MAIVMITDWGLISSKCWHAHTQCWAITMHNLILYCLLAGQILWSLNLFGFVGRHVQFVCIHGVCHDLDYQLSHSIYIPTVFAFQLCWHGCVCEAHVSQTLKVGKVPEFTAACSHLIVDQRVNVSSVSTFWRISGKGVMSIILPCFLYTELLCCHSQVMLFPSRR